MFVLQAFADVDSSSATQTVARRRSLGAILLEFLGSMNLAITLLVAVAIASVIGTVLRQGEPYQNYIIKFGPFWFEVFKALGLYSVYSATWFVLILAFLVISTSVCVYRHAPIMVRDMRHFRLNVKEKSLRAFKHKAEWTVPDEPAQAARSLAERIQGLGYKVRVKDHGDHLVVAGAKGGVNRLGYVATHIAVVVICIGALVDGNLPLKFAEWAGKVRVETRDIPASQVPAISRLGPENSSFRASVTIPEGGAANLAFLNVRDGYLVQELPFSVEVKDFRIEHYPTGQPKSFESDLVIHDPELEKPIEATIAVNHPLIHKNYAIYQASFGDGGSKLQLRAWPLQDLARKSIDFEGAVFQSQGVNTPNGPMTLEFTDFRLFNINPVEDDGSGKHFRNFGPNFTYKLRNAAGEAREFVNYMSPVPMEGSLFYLSGVRGSPSEPFRYLHLPADPKGGIERFMHFLVLIHDQDKVKQVAERSARQSLDSLQLQDPQLLSNVTATMEQLVGLFAQGGYDAVAGQTEQAPDEQRQSVLNAYIRVLQNMLGELYVELLREEGVDVSNGVSEEDSQFFDRAVDALAVVPFYGAPFYLQLTNFEHIQATGLQIARAPGQNVVYFGFVLIIAGVFLMFYVSHRRLWFWIKPAEGKTQVLFVGTANRNPLDFGREFDRLSAGLQAAVSKAPDSTD